MDVDVRAVAADRRRPAGARARRRARRAGPAARPRRTGPSLRPVRRPTRLAVALTQAELRDRAVAKFGELAASMYFTPGRARAGDPALRSPPHRAARLTAFGASTVVDLGCGIGGDLIAFARAGLTAAGVDLDPVRVAVATANLAALGLARRGRRSPTRSRWTPAPFDVAFADPARRTGRGRTFSVDAWTPPWSFVESLLAGDACVKTAPGIPHDAGPRRRRGRVGERPRRGEGGRALGRPARHGRPPRHRDPATAAWPP